LLNKVVQKFATTDLSPTAISNHDMGLVFEELIRRFAESSNETAGEHFTAIKTLRSLACLLVTYVHYCVSRLGDEDEMDLSNVAMSHYRFSKLRQQDIQLKANSTEHKLEAANDMGGKG